MNNYNGKISLDDILNRALDQQGLTRNEVRHLLSLEEESERAALFETARMLRNVHFGRSVFYYGFIYFSTYCRNRCTFCHYRAPNTNMRRYRQGPAEIMEAALSLADSGVHLIDLTMGEDPYYYRDSRAGFREIADLVRRIRSVTGRPVMVSPGAASYHALADLKEAGADWYACYQETYDRTLFGRLRTDQDYDYRLKTKKWAKDLGLLTEEGLLAGIGQSVDHMAESIIRMRNMNADQVRVMTYVPGPETLFRNTPPTDSREEINAIAVMRLVMPDRLIPASLDVDGLNGLEARLQAGANVVTSLVPPGRGLAGVAHDRLDIEDSRRTPAAVRPILEKCGQRPGEHGEYEAWIAKRRAYHNVNAGQTPDQLAGLTSEESSRHLMDIRDIS